MVAVRHVGTIDPYIAAAFSPDGETLYVNHDGSEIIAYSYPGLVAGATVVGPADPGNSFGSLACDDDDVLYFWEDTTSIGTALQSTAHGIITATVIEHRPIGLCWSPYDGHLYGYGTFTTGGEGEVLSRYHTNGDRDLLFEPVGSWPDPIDWVNGTVPTPDGGIWWVKPSPAAPAAWHVYRWDIATELEEHRVIVVDDAVVPYRDNRVYFYGDPSGAAPAAGYLLDFEAVRDDAPAFDAMSPGQRAAAYTPDFSLVCFERGATGEVWQIVAQGWTVGRVSWGARGAWH